MCISNRTTTPKRDKRERLTCDRDRTYIIFSKRKNLKGMILESVGRATHQFIYIYIYISVKHTCVFFLYILKLPSQIIMYSSQRSLSTIERKET